MALCSPACFGIPPESREENQRLLRAGLVGTREGPFTTEHAPKKLVGRIVGCGCLHKVPRLILPIESIHDQGRVIFLSSVYTRIGSVDGALTNVLPTALGAHAERVAVLGANLAQEDIG